MAVDPLSPIAPARIRALLLPAGRIKKASFARFVELLQPECSVRLGDVSPDLRPNRTMFSPLAFPSGILLYDFATTLPTPSQLALAPFELFREPMVIIGVADASEYSWLAQHSKSKPPDQDADSSDADDSTLIDATMRMREQFPNALVHQLLVFNHAGQKRHRNLPEETMTLPPSTQWKTTTVKTIMCDLSSIFLAEMTAFARSLQAMATLSSPATTESSAAEDNRSSMMLNPQDLSRRNSQMVSNSSSNPASPLTPTPSSLYRMSMPANLPSSSLPGSRPMSPSSEPRSPPAKTFDEIPGVNIAETLSRTSSAANKSNTSINSRNASQDRVSVHGFGPGGVLERARNKGIGRVGIAVGSLYLCAGLWPDALKELTEHATNARNLSDHLWHAKGLENILVCLILLAWRRVDFQIPQICYPNPEKTTNIPNIRSPHHTPSSSISSIKGGSPRSSFQIAAIQKLNAALPDLINMIFSIYSRAANFPGEALPPKAHSECIIRLSRFLAATHIAGGYLTDRALESLAIGTPYIAKANMDISRVTILPTKNEVASILLRALPTPQELSTMSILDGSVIFTGIASVLSTLHLGRKRALVIKQLISFMVPAIVQARKVGAAEMGVHPAAGLGLLGSAGGTTEAGRLGAADPETGLLEFLNLLGRVYGISHGSQPLVHIADQSKNAQVNGHGSARPESQEASGNPLIQNIQDHAMLHEFGNLNLKLDILRMCVNFCEALPDFQGVLHFTAALLRTAGPGNAPKPESPDVYVSLAKDEQLRHSTTIARTITTARRLGLQDVETEYWDDFFVRGISMVESTDSKVLKKHGRADLEAIKLVEDKRKSPFIHDPFLRSQESQSTDTLLVAADETEFVVSLQNPYEFEVEIEILGLIGEGLEFIAEERGLVLGPFRVQKFSITGIARQKGKLNITGCSIQIKGCRRQVFPIFTEPWSPEPNPKIKGIGLQASTNPPASRPVSGVSTSSESAQPPTSTEPVPLTLALNVLPPQPLIIATSVSLLQSSLMILEGERKRFTITLQNVSESTTNDFLHVSFEDSTTISQRNAMTNKELPRAELHELELQLAKNQPLRWVQADEMKETRIEPKESASFEIEVLGKPGLLQGVVQFDYANIGEDVATDHFFTRLVTVPIQFTVNASIQLHRFDILSFERNFAWSKRQRSDETESNKNLDTKSDASKSAIKRIDLSTTSDENCLLVLDFRNAWPSPLTISFSTLEPTTTTTTTTYLTPPPTHTIQETIQPGHITRLTIVLPKIHLPNPHAPIPSLNPANQRQFILSAAQHSPDAERHIRETFWYRAALLDLIRAVWTDEASGRTGEIDLRGIRLTARMVDALKIEDVGISLAVVSNAEAEAGGYGAEPQQLAPAKFALPVHAFATLRATVVNRALHPVLPLLRLQPSLANLPHGIALDLTRKFAVSGSLQRTLPLIAPGVSITADVGVCAMCTGVFEIGATVEEVLPWKELGGDEEEETRKADTNNGGLDELDGLLGEVEKRSWHAREPCVVVAVSEEET